MTAALAEGESFGAARARSSPASPAASSLRRTARQSFTGRSIHTTASISVGVGGTKATSRPLASPARIACPGRPSSAAVVTPSGSASGRRLQPAKASPVNTIPIPTRMARDTLSPSARCGAHSGKRCPIFSRFVCR